jgi:hypothetical protein
MQGPIPAHMNGYRISKQYYLFEKYRYLVPSPSDDETGFRSPTGLYDKDSDQQIQKRIRRYQSLRQRHMQ